MRRLLSVLAAAAVVAAPTVNAATCARQNVPGATLLVPYFRVSRNGSQGGILPPGGTDTLYAITNVGSVPVIVQAAVWNKYGHTVLAWNIPLFGHDVVFFGMRDVLNGHLNVNPEAQTMPDPCGRGAGFGESRFLRFENPDPEDRARGMSVYGEPAFGGEARRRVLDALDESGDISGFLSAGLPFVLDTDNPYCGLPSDGVLAGDFSGSMTFDVMNTCTNQYPDEPRRYSSGVLATRGWEAGGATPNVLMGDVFYVDGDRAAGHVSGDSMVSLAFDEGLAPSDAPTFYRRYSGTPAAAPFPPPAAYRFEGDGRLPLPAIYAARYLADRAQGLQSWLTVWHADVTPTRSGRSAPDLCSWLIDCRADPATCKDYGASSLQSQIALQVFDNDENRFVPGGSGGLSFSYHVYLQTQRIPMLDASDINPGGFRGGWLSIRFPGNFATNQAFLAVQHSGPGLALSVGHAATDVGVAGDFGTSRISCGVSLPTLSEVAP